MVNAKIPKTLQQKTVLTHVSGCASRLYMVEECTDNLEHQTPAERCIPPQDHIMLYTKQKLNLIYIFGWCVYLKKKGGGRR